VTGETPSQTIAAEGRPRCAARTTDCHWGLPALSSLFQALRIAQPCRCIKPETHKIAAHICAHGVKWQEVPA